MYNTRVKVIIYCIIRARVFVCVISTTIDASLFLVSTIFCCVLSFSAFVRVPAYRFTVGRHVLRTLLFHVSLFTSVGILAPYSSVPLYSCSSFGFHVQSDPHMMRTVLTGYNFLPLYRSLLGFRNLMRCNKCNS